MSYGTCFGYHRKAQLNTTHYCSACQISQSVEKSSKGDDSSPLSPTTPSRYGFLGYYLLINCVAVAFFDWQENSYWSLFGSLVESRITDALLTYLIGLGFLEILKRLSDVYRLAMIVFIALNLFLIYAIIDYFVDALPLFPINPL